MVYLGHVRNGQILLDEPARLPEGAAVSIELQNVRSNSAQPGKKTKLAPVRPITLPGGPLSDVIVSERR